MQRKTITILMLLLALGSVFVFSGGTRVVRAYGSRGNCQPDLALDSLEVLYNPYPGYSAMSIGSSVSSGSGTPEDTMLRLPSYITAVYGWSFPYALSGYSHDGEAGDHTSYTSIHLWAGGDLAGPAISYYYYLNAHGFNASDSGTYSYDSASLSARDDNRFLLEFYADMYSGTFSWGPTISLDADCSGGTPTPTPSPTPTNTPTPTPTGTPPPTPTPGAYAFPIKNAERMSTYTQPYPVGGGFTELNTTGMDNPAILMFGAPGTNVHAATVGTVESVTKLSGNCQGNTIKTACQARQLGFTLGYWLYYDQASLVTIQADDGNTLFYVVGAPNVSAGQTVSKGCILGTTLQVSEVNLLALPAESPTPYGYTMVWAEVTGTSTAVDLVPLMTDDPPDIICSSSTADHGCTLVNNPTLAYNGSGWQFQPPFGATNNLPQTGPDGEMLAYGTWSQVLNLDSGTNYTITVQWYPVSFPYNGFSVQLGGTTTQINEDNVTGPTTTVIPAATYSPNSDSLYHLIISPGEKVLNATVAVSFICVAASDGTPVAPNACMLVNNTLRNVSNYGWTTDFSHGGHQEDGAVYLKSGDSISQSLYLSNASGGGSEDYTLSMMIESESTVGSSDTATANWSWGSASGSIVAPVIVATLADTLTVSTAGTNDLTITASGTATLKVALVCVETQDGSPPPGYHAPPEGPAPGMCSVNSYKPTGDLPTDFSRGINWFWLEIKNLWDCQAETILYGIWTGVVNLIKFLAFLRMWAQLTFYGLIGWLNAQFVNLGIYISNALVRAQFGTVITGGGGAGLGDVLVSLFNTIRGIVSDLAGLGQSIVNAITALGSGIIAIVLEIVQILGAVVTLILSFITGFLGNAIGILLGIFQSLINGWNMSAVSTSTYIPSCTDTSSSLIYLCAGLSLIEDQLQTGVAAWIVPIVLGIASMNLLLWGVGQIVGAFRGGSDA